MVDDTSGDDLQRAVVHEMRFVVGGGAVSGVFVAARGDRGRHRGG